MHVMTKTAGAVLLAGVLMFVIVGGKVIATTAGRVPAQGGNGAPDQSTPPLRDVRIENLGKDFRLLGRTGKPFGELSSIVASVFNSRYKGENKMAVVLEVDGQAMDETVILPISDLWPKIERVKVKRLEESEPGLYAVEYRNSFDVGFTYRFTGFETGDFRGRSEEAVCAPQGLVAEAAKFRFRCEYKVCRSELINYETDPGKRVGRNAFIEGRAENRGDRAFIVGDGWSLALTNAPAWKEWELAKSVNGVGVVQPGSKAGEYTLEPSRFGLSRLEDMVGCRVKVHGMAYSMNTEHRSLLYRDRTVDVVLTDRSLAKGWPFDEPVWVECTVSREPSTDGERKYVLNVEKWGTCSGLLPQEEMAEPPR